MKNICQLILMFASMSFLRADLNVENAFPNLSFQDPVGYIMQEMGQIVYLY